MLRPSQRGLGMQFVIAWLAVSQRGAAGVGFNPVLHPHATAPAVVAGAHRGFVKFAASVGIPTVDYWCLPLMDLVQRGMVDPP